MMAYIYDFFFPLVRFCVYSFLIADTISSRLISFVAVLDLISERKIFRP